ncbi:MAG: hypothetical protein H7328_04465 [Bdellovibrio sp.]|nr:hypothetical protein [Bdellovibrio sp.]
MQIAKLKIEIGDKVSASRNVVLVESQPKESFCQLAVCLKNDDDVFFVTSKYDRSALNALKNKIYVALEPYGQNAFK